MKINKIKFVDVSSLRYVVVIWSDNIYFLFVNSIEAVVFFFFNFVYIIWIFNRLKTIEINSNSCDERKIYQKIKTTTEKVKKQEDNNEMLKECVAGKKSHHLPPCVLAYFADFKSFGRSFLPSLRPIHRVLCIHHPYGNENNSVLWCFFCEMCSVAMNHKNPKSRI